MLRFQTRRGFCSCEGATIVSVSPAVFSIVLSQDGIKNGVRGVVGESGGVVVGVGSRGGKRILEYTFHKDTAELKDWLVSAEQ